MNKKIKSVLATVVILFVLAFAVNRFSVNGKVVQTIDTGNQTFFLVDRETGATDGFVTAVYSGPKWLGPLMFNQRATIPVSHEQIHGQMVDQGLVLRIDDPDQKATSRKIPCGNDVLEIQYSK